MFWKFVSITLFVVSCDVKWVLGQVCIPNPVEYIGLTTEQHLTWSASENCPDTQYVVKIHTREGIAQYEYIVDSLSLDINFLRYCRGYNFTVIPLSDHVLGMETFLTASLALPEDIDIAILGFNISEINDDMLLQWHVQENYTHCVTYYYMLEWDEDSDDPEIFHLQQEGYFLENAPHCMSYRFEVTAHYYIWKGTTGHYNYTMPAATNDPMLVYLRQDATTINTTWSLESYTVNRCKVTALHVSGPRFNVTIPVTDVPERPNIEVTLRGLKANSMYYMNVTVENEAGISKPYQLAVQTLPIESES